MDLFDWLLVLGAVAFNLSIVGVLIATKTDRPDWRRTCGLFFASLGIPFTVVAIHYASEAREPAILLAIGCVLAYIAVELVLDYVLHVEFRRRLVTHIPYIVLEYLALFSLVWLAFAIDRTWGWIVTLTFWAVLGSVIALYVPRRATANGSPS